MSSILIGRSIKSTTYTDLSGFPFSIIFQMLSNLAVSTHSGGISVAMEGRERSPSMANSGCYVLARFGVVLASPQY